MKIAVITACFGGMDSPKKLPAQTRGLWAGHLHYIAITEKNSPVQLGSFDARMRGRYFKMQGHESFPGYDALVWIDGNVQIKSSTFVAEMIDALDGCDIAIARHPSRNCIYEEADFIANGIKAGDAYLKARYDAGATHEQVEEYREAGHPPGWGLFWCGLFARRVNSRTNKFFDQWWEHCLRWPRAIDQTSFAYLARKFDLKIGLIDFGNFYENATYKLIHHRKVQ